MIAREMAYRDPGTRPTEDQPGLSYSTVVREITTAVPGFACESVWLTDNPRPDLVHPVLGDFATWLVFRAVGGSKDDLRAGVAFLEDMATRSREDPLLDDALRSMIFNGTPLPAALVVAMGPQSRAMFDAQSSADGDSTF